MKKILFLTLIIGVIIYGCKNDDEKPSTIIGKEYCPLKVDKYSVYKVKEVVYNGLDNLTFPCDNGEADTFIVSGTYVDTFNYYLKELTQGYYIDSQGDTIYRIFRFKKNTLEEDWPSIPDSVWHSYYRINNFIRNESNTPKIKLGFPVAKLTKWDANQLNTLTDGDDDKIILLKEYLNLDTTIIIGNNSFSDCIYTNGYGSTKGNNGLIDGGFTVLKEDEWYAKGIGLVKLHHSRLLYCNTNDYDEIKCNCDEQEIVNKGFILTQELIEHN